MTKTKNKKPNTNSSSTNTKFKPNQVTVLSTENKQLPFPMAKHFKYIDIPDLKSFSEELKKAKSNNDIKVIAVDSLTRITFMVKSYLKSRKVSGYKFWAKYSEMLSELLTSSVKTKKWLVFLSLSDIKFNSDGDEVRQVKIQGNELDGLIESWFTIVLFTDVNNDEKDIHKRYRLCTNSDGSNTAKTPMNMFNKQYIHNNLRIVFDRIAEYYDFKPNDFDIKRPSILVVGRSGTGKTTSLYDLIENQERKG